MEESRTHAVYRMRFGPNTTMFPTWIGDHWLGHKVSFKMNGHRFIGEVVGTHRHYLVNGIHDILTVELEGEKKQVKIEGHRQMFRRIYDGD